MMELLINLPIERITYDVINREILKVFKQETNETFQAELINDWKSIKKPLDEYINKYPRESNDSNSLTKEISSYLSDFLAWYFTEINDENKNKNIEKIKSVVITFNTLINCNPETENNESKKLISNIKENIIKLTNYIKTKNYKSDNKEILEILISLNELLTSVHKQ